MPPKKASSPRKTSLKKRVPASPKKVTTRRSAKRDTGSQSHFARWLDTISPTSILAIGLCVVVISIVQSLFVDIGDWYASLPDIALTLTGWPFEFALTGIFAFVTTSIVIVWNMRIPGKAFLVWLFVLLGMLHLMWSMFFFGLHMVQVSAMDAIALWLLVVVLMLLIWKRSKIASLMLFPYFAWVTFVGVFNGLVVFSSLT